MQRPVMDPMLLAEPEDPILPRRGRTNQLRELFKRAFAVTRRVAKVLFSKPFHVRKREPQESAPTLARFLRGVGYRLLFVPIFLALAASALVYRGTHPVRAANDKLPEVPGVFYETLEFSGADGQPLMAWFVPVVDAKRVLELKNKVFKGKQPAVVLVHDFNASPSQMVPLIAPLHEQGYIVLAVGLRGAGRGNVAAQTFGLNEASDVRAALAELRKHPTADAEHVAIVGVGSGANAAVITAAQEAGVGALALVNATDSPEQVIARRVGPTRPGLCWMQLASKWAFEVAYHVDAEDLQLSRFRDVLKNKPTLSLVRAKGQELDADAVGSISDFCKKNLPSPGAASIASTSN
jgi:pimeloyl-ACP methyl ester carboxylesterase